MLNQSFKIFIFVAATAASNTAPALADWKEVFATSWIEGPSHPALLTQLQQLATRYTGFARFIPYGQSAQGRTLALMRLQKPTAPVAQVPAVLIFGAVHGNENLNIPDGLLKWMLSARNSDPALQNFFDRGGIAYIIPVFNPDGYTLNQRRSINEIDLNRDFLDRVSPETAAFTHFLEEDVRASNASLQVTVDYHCCLGAVLFPGGYDSPTFPQEDKDNYRAIVRAAREYVTPFLFSGTPRTVLGYDANGSSKDYLYTRFHTLAVTFEGHSFIEPLFLEGHIRWWRWLLNAFPGKTAQAHGS